MTWSTWMRHEHYTPSCIRNAPCASRTSAKPNALERKARGQEISVPSRAVSGCPACLEAWDVELPGRPAAGGGEFRAGEASADGLPGGLAVAIRASRPDHPSRNPVSL